MSELSPHPEDELLQLLRSIDERAPEELHRRVDALVDRRSSRQRRSRRRRTAPTGLLPPAWRIGGAATVLAAAGALMLGLTGGGSSVFTLHEASAITLQGATMPAPPENTSRRGELARSVDGIAFPYWEDGPGWRATGMRVDRAGGRPVTTVFYADARGQRLGYAIVAGTPAPALHGGALTWRSGRTFRLLADDGARLVAWNRDGHLCVLAARSVASAQLLRLASSTEGWPQ